MIYEILINMILALSSLYVHELCHYFSAKMLGVETKLSLKNFTTWVRNPTYFEYYVIVLSGVIIGVIPIIFITDTYLRYLMYFAYFLGCLSDIISIIKLISHYRFNVPKWILRIDEIFTIIHHHRYCNCNRCVEIKNAKYFSFRA
jgi:hypothetical protein